MRNKELLAELKAYSDSLRQKVEAKFEGGMILLLPLVSDAKGVRSCFGL